MRNRLLQYTVLLILLVNVVSTGFVLYRTQQTLQSATAQATASNQGTVGFCFNQPPVLDPPCSPNMSQDQPYSCQLNATDPDGTDLTFFVIPEPPDNVSLFNVSAAGLINFTPRNADRGNHSVLLGVDDNSGCENAYAYQPFNFTVANVNDPPYLVRPIPNQNLSVNTTLYAFFLNDYFADPDGDPMAFALLPSLSSVQINATINPDSSVVFTASQCGKAYFKFRATDPYNASGDSNIVSVESICPTAPTGGVTTGSTGGGGGGGGGASVECTPELICLPWSDCYPNGLQEQVCRDKNGCSDTEIRFQQNCTYNGPQPQCRENWLCADWSVCSMAGTQNRTCKDLDSCQTTRYRPPLEQECVYKPTCSDGVQNGNETGVDCGGDCPACKTIQQPSPFAAKQSFGLLLSLLLFLFLAILLALFVLYRERVYEGMAELGWLLAPHRRKELLLDAGEKKVVFEELALLDKDRASKEKALPVAKAYERLADAVRKYLSFALRIPYEHLPQERAAALAAAKLSDGLRETLLGLAGRLDLLESGKLPAAELNGTLFSSVEEELRLLVCMTSEYALPEIERALPERKVTPQAGFFDEVRLRLLNAYEALQFQRVELAKEEYSALLRAYENLLPQEKEALYPDIRRLYAEITYVQETTEQ